MQGEYIGKLPHFNMLEEINTVQLLQLKASIYWDKIIVAIKTCAFCISIYVIHSSPLCSSTHTNTIYASCW